MDEMEEKLGSILNNPQMMQQIMAMAQALGHSQPQTPPEPPPEPQPTPPPQPALPNLDAATLQRVMGLARQTGIDRNQQALLRALGPYLSRDRIRRLEKAMQAAKMANLVSSALGASGMTLFSGR